jgi:predicted enzyme related to lactoylglutathione lyase
MTDFHGKFVWYELMTTDTKAAEAFYRRVVGWGAKDARQPGMEYTLFTVGEAQVAGMMAIPEAVRAAGGRPGWLAHVAVDDVDARAAQMKAASGTIHREPTDIPGIGRFSIVADPQGAVISLFRGEMTSEPPPSAPPGTPGHVGWHELMAADGAAAFAFYATLFGWTKGEAVDMGPMGVYQIFARDGQPTGGMMTKPPTMPAPAWNYYFNVEAIDAAAARVTEAGGQVVNGPHQVPGGSWIVQCIDPQGAVFALVAAQR